MFQPKIQHMLGHSCHTYLTEIFIKHFKSATQINLPWRMNSIMIDFCNNFFFGNNFCNNCFAYSSLSNPMTCVLKYIHIMLWYKTRKAYMITLTSFFLWWLSSHLKETKTWSHQGKGLIRWNLIQYGYIIVKQRSNCYQSPHRGQLSIFKIGDGALGIIGHGDGDVSVDAPWQTETLYSF